MSLPELVVPAASVATVGVILRYGSDAVLRLVAGITAIVAKDERPRAQRALEVLRLVRRDSHAPPPEAPPTDRSQ
jgi:hypothetical protein